MSYSLLRLTQPKARKEHACMWCREPIRKGRTYTRESSVFEGNMQDHAWHPECYTAAQKWFRETGEDSFDPHEHARGSVHGEPLYLPRVQYRLEQCCSSDPVFRVTKVPLARTVPFGWDCVPATAETQWSVECPICDACTGAHPGPHEAASRWNKGARKL